MVVTSIVAPGNCQVEIRPNQSMSWRTQKFCYIVMVAFSMFIAGGFAVLGFWPILPFAGVELLFLGVAFYLCALQGKQRQVVVVGQDTVAVICDKGGKASKSRRFKRAWTTILLAKPTTGIWYPSRLTLRSHGNEVELGKFLNEQERRLLAKERVASSSSSS